MPSRPTRKNIVLNMNNPASAGSSRRATKTISKMPHYKPNSHTEDAPAVDAFIEALEEEVRNDPEGKLRRVSFESLEELLDATQNYYERAESAESKSRINFIAGLAGGAALTTSILGITSLVRRRKNQRRNGSK